MADLHTMAHVWPGPHNTFLCPGPGWLAGVSGWNAGVMLAALPRVLLPCHRAPPAIPATPGAMQMSHVSSAGGTLRENNIQTSDRG